MLHEPYRPIRLGYTQTGYGSSAAWYNVV